MQYRYTGPLGSVTLPDGAEHRLSPGETVALPDDTTYTQVLLARGWLTPVPEAVAPEPAPEVEAAPINPDAATEAPAPKLKPKK